jgi:hypothetical protein
MGEIVQGLVEIGANLGVSSRGLGTLKMNNGIMEVQDDFKLVTAADIVSDPSAPNAYVQGVMENVEWIYENGDWVASKHKEEIKKLSMKQLEEAKFRLFKNFLESISCKFKRHK